MDYNEIWHRLTFYQSENFTEGLSSIFQIERNYEYVLKNSFAFIVIKQVLFYLTTWNQDGLSAAIWFIIVQKFMKIYASVYCFQKLLLEIKKIYRGLLPLPITIWQQYC